MVQTRAMRKRSARSTRKSHCRGKKPYACIATRGCKRVKGKKRTFCRKKKNTKRMKGGNTTHHKPIALTTGSPSGGGNAV